MRRELQSNAANSGAVRVTLPLSVAYDIDKFQQALRNVAQLTGCTGCTSGTDVTFLTAREFVVDPASLEVTVAGAGVEFE